MAIAYGYIVGNDASELDELRKEVEAAADAQGLELKGVFAEQTAAPVLTECEAFGQLVRELTVAEATVIIISWDNVSPVLSVRHAILSVFQEIAEDWIETRAPAGE